MVKAGPGAACVRTQRDSRVDTVSGACFYGVEQGRETDEKYCNISRGSKFSFKIYL